VTRTVWYLPTMAALVMLGACGTTPQSNFYTLAPPAASDVTYTVRPMSVVVTTVTVPEIVDRPQIVVRVNDNQVRFDEYARWADSLKSQIQRTVAADLAMALDGARVSSYPQEGDAASTWRVRVDVLRFDAVPGDAVTVDALWSVSVPKSGTGAAPLSGRTVTRVPCAAAGYDAVAAAYSSALAVVSRDIAVAIHAGLPR
jgi:uncharacterized protein